MNIDAVLYARARQVGCWILQLVMLYVMLRERAANGKDRAIIGYNLSK